MKRSSAHGPKKPETGRKLKSRMEEVYTKAAMLFRNNGYLNTSMTEIANEMGIQKASLYYYTKDKEALLFTILNRTMDTMLASVGGMSIDHLPPEEQLTRIIKCHFVNAVRLLNEFSALLHDTKHLRPDLCDIILGKRKAYENIFLRILQEGIASKAFVAHDEKMAVFMLLGSCNWFYQWYSPRGALSPEEIAEIFASIYLNGMRGR